MCNRMQWYAEPIANLLRIGEIDAGRAILLGIVFLPVLHEQSFDLVTLLQQQVGGYGRIDAAGHAHYDFFTAAHERLMLSWK